MIKISIKMVLTVVLGVFTPTDLVSSELVYVVFVYPEFTGYIIIITITVCHFICKAKNRILRISYKPTYCKQ